MKGLKLSIAVLMILAASACKKSEDTTVQTKLSTDEAADMVSGSLALNSNGAVSNGVDLSVSANVVVTTKINCGATKTDSVSRAINSGSVTYSYKAKSTYTVICNGFGVPDSLAAAGTFTDNYSGPNLSFSHAGSSTLSVGGLLPTTLFYVLSGEHKASGSFKSKIDTTNNGSDMVDIVISKMTINKLTHLPTSGTGTFTVNGTIPKKGSFSFAGTIVFNPDATAKVTVNTTVYLVNLITGQRTRR